VTRLALARPAGFRESPGDYVFLRVPELAKLEWHPFTLSSAPEDEELSIHVRSVGNWTRALEARVAARRGGSGAEDGGDGGGSMEAFVDGPYGTPSAQIFRARRVVLVAGGIGVTPFASVLRSLLARRRRGETGGVERVHFVWICREQGAFAWFAELLGELEREAPELFDIQIFMDGGARDAKSTVLRIAMDLLYAETRSDLVTGLRARTTLGPPDFPELFAQIAREHAPDPVDAFFCGPEGLAKVVKRAARAAGMSFRQEHF
jgi:predicted ferric reductase